MKAVLAVSDVSKAFGGLQVLTKINLQVNESEILGLVGPTGAGKTTLFNILSGAMKADTGQISLFGTDIQHKKAFEIAKLGLVRTFQVVRPFPNMTCSENLEVAIISSSRPCASKAKFIQELLEMVGLQASSSAIARSLTLMQKKKLEIARALATSPKVLLLDEVMSGLNSTEMNEAIALLHSLKRERGLTIIWIEHVMKAVMSTADRVTVLHQGQILKVATPAEVAHDPKVIEVYLGSNEHA